MSVRLSCPACHGEKVIRTPITFESPGVRTPYRTDPCLFCRGTGTVDPLPCCGRPPAKDMVNPRSLYGGQCNLCAGRVRCCSGCPGYDDWCDQAATELTATGQPMCGEHYAAHQRYLAQPDEAA